jgi:hypothetical protein
VDNGFFFLPNPWGEQEEMLMANNQIILGMEDYIMAVPEGIMSHHM